MKTDSIPFTRCVAALLACLALQACATRVTEAPNDVTDAERPFGSFDRVLLVSTELAKPYAEQSANISAAKRIDLVLAQQVGPVLNDVEIYTAQEVDNMDLAGTSTLLIRPLVKQIKFLNVGTRILAGPAGGSGVIVMDTAYVDGATGEVLANPGYFRKAGAWSSTFSSADNRMLTSIAEDVAEYTRRFRCTPGERWRPIELAESEDSAPELDESTEATTAWRYTPRECRAPES